ncbi:MAG: type-4 uracil-DNA glycosylase [Conexivisphaera sp.]
METLEEVADAVKLCRACPLHASRRNAVPGEGTGRSGVMFVGEAPGRNEDEQGRPFVGAAGQLLTDLMTRILGLRREEVFITNVVKCRPPGNREPEPEEVAACWRYLEAQVRILRPRLIVALGRHAATALLSGPGARPLSISEVRGRPRVVRIGGHEVTVFPTLHPAAALYNRQQVELLEGDFRRVAGMLRGSGTLDQFIRGTRNA